MKQSLGQFIQKVRTDKKITQEQLAISSGLARSYISRMEDDQFKSPSAMVLIRLAKGLGVSHDTIFQIAGYIPKIAKTELPSFDVYLRTKFPKISEQGINDIEFYINAVEKRYKNKP
jgi:transcriptional regulator with XRE-family HTH domain